MDKLSYAFGRGIAYQLKELGLADRLVVADFAQCVEDVLKGNEPKMPFEEVKEEIDAYLQERRKVEEERLKEIGMKNLAEEQVFLVNNGKREGIHTTDSGIQYEVLEEGAADGEKPSETDTVEVHYQGTFVDGTVFDSSYKRGETAIFPLDQVIPGWTEGLQLMSVGSAYRFWIPSRLAYGERGAGDVIPPGKLLVFEVKLIDIKKAEEKEDGEKDA